MVNNILRFDIDCKNEEVKQGVEQLLQALQDKGDKLRVCRGKAAVSRFCLLSRLPAYCYQLTGIDWYINNSDVVLDLLLVW